MRLEKLKCTLVWAIAVATFCGVVTAQTREKAAPSAMMSDDRVSLESVGRVFDQAYRSKEFFKVLRSGHLEAIQAVLRSNGLPRSVPVQWQGDVVPATSTSYCYPSAINYYLPNPPYSWPNNPRTIVLIVCVNVANGLSSTGWPTN